MRNLKGASLGLTGLIALGVAGCSLNKRPANESNLNSSTNYPVYDYHMQHKSHDDMRIVKPYDNKNIAGWKREGNLAYREGVILKNRVINFGSLKEAQNWESEFTREKILRDIELSRKMKYPPY
ncbi:MAG: hypothetical protein Q7S74_00220 [Nanoarchaeota archaeon]|nr:hypothetical protein [Nanoarchaeota archaeon]